MPVVSLTDPALDDRRACLADALTVALGLLGLARAGELVYNTYGGTVGVRVLDGTQPFGLRTVEDSHADGAAIGVVNQLARPRKPEETKSHCQSVSQTRSPIVQRWVSQADNWHPDGTS